MTHRGKVGLVFILWGFSAADAAGQHPSESDPANRDLTAAADSLVEAVLED